MIATPRATYRLQFREGTTFERAAALAPYLARLGLSHLYASPLFRAAPGSTHGYDGVDFAALEPEIGGEDGFRRMSDALRAEGLGLILDFVPNHMAASETNRWWQAVLEWGAASPLAAVFDIDWSARRLVLPILSAPYGEVLAAGDFGLDFDASSGRFAFACYDRRLPLTPPSYTAVLARAGPAYSELARRFALSTPGTAPELMRRLAQSSADSARAEVLTKAARAVTEDRDALHAVHEAQVWRLAHWRLAREALTHRRFFEISDLVCLRVHEPQAFRAVHARLIDLIGEGRVDGIRLDHIDGLADPKAYLETLQQAIGGGEPHYLLVEKICEADETLRRGWPVTGTTGYEFIAALAGLYVDAGREAAMTRAYAAFTGEETNYATAARTAKRMILYRNLAAELDVLTRRALAVAGAALGTRDLAADTLRRAIVEVAAALPVYRSYIDAAGPDSIDRALIEETAAAAKATREVEDKTAVDFVARMLGLDFETPATQAAALEFTIRFQQTTGPVMAKAIEDTMFYRYNRLIALNEVGGAPDRYGGTVDGFHRAMEEREATQPGGLSATATHDSKRGEDARARLYVLSEMPERWAEAVRRWAEVNAPFRAGLADGPVPEPRMEWLFYQALAGAWPAALAPEDREGVNNLTKRMAAYMEKAAREAKLRTSWTATAASYEAALGDFVRGVLGPGNGGFLMDFVDTCRPVWLAGAVNSLSQLAIKLAAPGVPDFYQGDELWDLNLVDPDNRRPVDFEALARALDSAAGQPPEALLRDWRSGAPKMALTAAGLRLRARLPELFARGRYVPLEASGERAGHVIAFAREFGDRSVVVIAPRLALPLTESAALPLPLLENWGDTAIRLSPPLAARGLRDALTGVDHGPSVALRIAETLAAFPAALLASAE